MTRKISRWRRSKLRWLFEYGVVLGIRTMIGPLSRSMRLRAGHLIGSLAKVVLPSRRRTALHNLELAFPEQSAAWRIAVARGSFRHLGRLGVEVLFLDSLIDDVDVEGWEHLEAVASAGRGYFLMSAHFGNWELCANLQAARGYPVSMVTRPLDNPLLERMFSNIRQSTGNRVIHKRSAVREMIRGLKAGEGVAIVIDQNFREKGAHFVPFFNKLAATTPSLGAVSMKLGVPVLPVFTYPLDDGRYRLCYEEPIYPSDAGSGDEAIAITATATRRIEEAIRRCPHPWFWMHNRWKSRPQDDEAKK